MSPAVIKGAVLIVVGLLLGGFLLSGIEDGSATVETDGESDRSTDGGEDQTEPTVSVPDDSDGTTSTTAGDTRAPEDISVLVANASGIPQAASKVSDELGAAGFVTVEPSNADVTADVTLVYFVGNEEAAATSVAETLGLGEDAVQPMPDPPPVPDMKGATVLVLLGPDRAPTA